MRRLPSVEELAAALDPAAPRAVAVVAAREEIADLRRRMLAGERIDAVGESANRGAAARIKRLRAPSLRGVINATGVVLHTNLGRAPLPAEAVEAVAVAGAGYSNLELDLDSGERGSRHAHVEGPLREASGAEAAIAVNNNAAGVLLALAATAAGREVVVGRGQLIEIGGSFRIPEILAQSGARLVEVGTTNRTRLGDYERAIGPETAAILRVHQSNFRAVGFVEEVELAALAELARSNGIALIDDLGSGALTPIGDEAPLRRSVEAGADLVCCSADKLLGGPQAGIIVGARGAVEACRRHPLARALRLDKLQIAALEATLRAHRDHGPAAIPALAMLAATEEELLARARRLVDAIGPRAAVGRDAARPGGGSLPLVELPGPVCVIDPGDQGPDRLAAALRAGEPPVIARIAEQLVLLDPRTIADREVDRAAAAVGRVLV
ncbi:MAG: L-seryl-tRNA(Sec) selenium transferase [Solirubrobacterales bacterium]|nr:L-seryl-tRNA(Sec) selenium transferase [Solirubrobacterales bacterium]